MRYESRIGLLSLITLSAVIMMSTGISAEPSPHDVFGNVYGPNGQYQPGASNVRINTTSTKDSVLGSTPGSGTPEEASAYSITASGEDSEDVLAIAWNATHYGINSSVSLASGDTYIDIVISALRPSETNVSISYPSGTVYRELDSTFILFSNVSAIGGSGGAGCSAEISFSPSGILSVTSGDTASKSLGAIPLGDFRSAYWNLTAEAEGSVSIRVSSSCTSDSINFENLSSGFYGGLTVNDTQGPSVSLISPGNNSIIIGSDGADVTFSYVVDDASSIKNCSLIIGGLVNESQFSVAKGITREITVNAMKNGTYLWYVKCFDDSLAKNNGSSAVYNLTINQNSAPQADAIEIHGPGISLLAGGASTVTCNATFIDVDGESDISSVSAEFYDTRAGSGEIDDYNDHYSNSSCTKISSAGTQATYSCGFSLQYFANNGTWQCNITAEDAQGEAVHQNTTTIVYDLLAIELSESIVEFDDLETKMSSSQDANISITNIGNTPLNLSVEGFGAYDGDGKAMVCTSGSVPISNERYSPESGTAYDEMIMLSDEPALIPGFSLPQRIGDFSYGADRNKTFWKLRLPESVRGSCNGTIVFRGVQI